MHFRLGSMSIPFLTTVLLQLEEEGRLSLDDPLAKWLPSSGYPNADRVTPGMLARSTSGYPDWIQGNPTFVSALLADPFRTWTESELLGYAFAQPLPLTIVRRPRSTRTITASSPRSRITWRAIWTIPRASAPLPASAGAASMAPRTRAATAA